MKIGISIIGILYLVNFAFALEYDPTYPPTLFPTKVIKEENYKAFQFIGRDLLIPDKVEYDNVIYEIIQVGEEGRFKPIAIFELDGVFETQRAKTPQAKQPDPILAYKQSMWLRGLEVASRDYKMSQDEFTRCDGFKVDFQEGFSGRIMAILTLYKSKGEPLEEIKGELQGIKAEIQKLQDKISDWSAEANKQFLKYDGSIKVIEKDIESIEKNTKNVTDLSDNILTELRKIIDELNDVTFGRKSIKVRE